jgi:hypothetical protein
MSADFCELWTAFIAEPEGAARVDEVRAVHHALLEHVEECASCTEAAARTDPARVYERLAALDETPRVDDSAAAAMLSARAGDRDGIERAVTEALLPALPPDLGYLQTLGGDVTPRTLFLSLDAVRMLLKRKLRSRVSAALKTLAMRSDGTVVLNTDVLVPAEVLAAEIGQYAGLEDRSARRVLEWIPAAARSQPRLLPGIDADGASRSDGVWLKMVPWDAVTSDLYERWKVVATRAPRVAVTARPARRRVRGLEART